MPPVGVARMPAAGRRCWLPRVTIKPLPDIEMVELLAPQHSGQRLALHETHVLICNARVKDRIERVRVPSALCHHLVEVGEARRLRHAQAQPDTHNDTLSGRYHSAIDAGHLSTAPFGAD